MRKEIVVERILLADGFAIDGVAIVRPVREIGADFTLTRAVIQIAVSDGLCATHLVDADVTIGNRAMRQREVETHGTE